MHRVISSKATYMFKYVMLLFFLPLIIIIFSEDKLLLLLVCFTFLIFTLPFWWISIKLKYIILDKNQFTIKNYFRIIHINMSDIEDIHENLFFSTIILKKKSEFGKKIIFRPPYRLHYFSPHPLIIELKEMIDSYKMRNNIGVKNNQ